MIALSISIMAIGALLLARGLLMRDSLDPEGEAATDDLEVQ